VKGPQVPHPQGPPRRNNNYFPGKLLLIDEIGRPHLRWRLGEYNFPGKLLLSEGMRFL
jgi:hypothetical protein